MCVCRMYGVRVCFVRRERRRKVWRRDGRYGGGLRNGHSRFRGRGRGNAGAAASAGGATHRRAEWNDNKNYEFFKSLFDKEIVAPQPDESGNVPDVLIYKENIFTPYAQDEVWGKDENAVVHHETWGMSPLRRVEVKVKGADGNPAAGASVRWSQKEKRAPPPIAQRKRTLTEKPICSLPFPSRNTT